MIELRDVTFTYRQADPTPASEAPGVRGIDLTVSDGRCVLVCGASGCGKTTITRLANGLAPAFFAGELSGQVLIDGEDCAGLESWQVAERVGSVFQNPRTQFFNVDSTGEVAFTLESMGWPEEKIRERTDATISELGLSTLADRSIFSLSGGQRQRIAYASAWAAHPRNLVLDEPTGNLDLESIRALRGYLRDAKRKGAAILVTEHRLWWLLNVVDEVVVMAGGGIAQRLTPVEFAALDSCGLAGLGLRTTDIREVRATSPRGTGSSPEPFLQARGLRARYGRQEVLHGVDLEVRSGETVALTGGNGAGKSTLARVLCGLHRASAGTIRMRGGAAFVKDRNRASAIVFQDVGHQLFANSVQAEVTLGLPKARVPSAEHTQEILDCLGLAQLAGRHPATLSGGQKQRLAIAACIASGKSLLILDEPTSGLDLVGMRAVAGLVRELAAAGHALLVITHDAEFVAACCQRVIRLAEGRVATDIPVYEDDLVWNLMTASREPTSRG